MRILIVDDETLARARLKRMLANLNYNDVSEACNASEAIEAVKSAKFDLAFLDINMPEISGLELGYELRYLDENIKIIFQTAHAEHALKAYDIGAIGYLIKPYSNEDLKQTISRVQVPINKEGTLRIMSKIGDNHFLLQPAEIYYVKADLTEVMIRSARGFSYYSQKISDLQQRLSNYDFVQIHRSFLININKIKEIKTIEQSKLRFSFADIADEIDSSKDGAKAFREKFST